MCLRKLAPLAKSTGDLPPTRVDFFFISTPTGRAIGGNVHCGDPPPRQHGRGSRVLPKRAPPPSTPRSLTSPQDFPLQSQFCPPMLLQGHTAPAQCKGIGGENWIDPPATIKRTGLAWAKGSVRRRATPFGSLCSLLSAFLSGPTGIV